MIKESLALRVLVISFLLLGLPLLIASFVLFERAYESDIAVVKNNLKESATYRAVSLGKSQPFSGTLLNEIDFFIDFEKLLKEDKRDEIAEKLKRIALKKNVGIFFIDSGKEGQFNLIASNYDQVSPRFIPYSTFENLICDEGKISMVSPFTFIDSEKLALPLFYQIASVESKSTNEIIGYIIAISSLKEKVDSLLLGSEQFEQVMRFALLHDNGKVLAASDPLLVGHTLTPLSIERKESSSSKYSLPMILEEKGPFFEFIWGKRVEIGYLYPFPDKGFSLLAYSSKDEVFSAAIRHFFIIYTALGVIIVIGAAVTYKMTQLMSKPFKQLRALIERVRKGDLKGRFIEEKLGFEINILGHIFNETIVSLIDNVQKERDNRILKETYQSEVEIGQSVQRQLLPRALPEVKGVEFYASYLPSNVVGGDFYDLQLKGGKISLLVADAAGKGISSCLYALGLRSQIRACHMLYDEVGVILSKANNLFVRDTGESGMFVTALMGIYDPVGKTLSYFSSGHVPGIVRKKDGTLRFLSHRGMALGLMESEPYSPEVISLESGDLLLLYTDGLTEAANEKHQYFGEARLKNMLLHRRWFTAREVVEGLVEEVTLFRGDVDIDEEITLLAMRVVDV